MKLVRNKQLSLIAATSMTIFSLAAVFVGVIAWFQMERVFNGGDDFAVNNITGRLKKVTFHTLNSKTEDSEGRAISFSFNKNYVGSITYDWDSNTGTYVPNGEGNTKISLPDYDPLDQEHPIMLLFEYNDEYDASTGDPFAIKVNSTQTDFLGGRDPSTNLPIHPLSQTYKGTVDNNPYYALSSVVNFYNVQLSDDDFDTLDGGTYYTLFKPSESQSSGNIYLNDSDDFVYVNNDTNVSAFEPNVTISSYNTGNIRYTAIVIDYYLDAVEYVYSTFLGDDTLEVIYDYYLKYACDWSMEVI